MDNQDENALEVLEAEDENFGFQLLPETRALNQVLGHNWAILEPNFQDILNIASRSMLDVQKAVALAEAKHQQRFEAMSGERLKGTRSVIVDAEGRAIVPVFDSLFRRGGMFSSISGAMSMEQIEADIVTAYQSKNVSSVGLDMDTPGGEVSYTEELANSIYNLRMDGGKKIWAFSSGMCCSAGIWIASATAHRTATPTSIWGSVGVMSTYIGTKEFDKQRGIKRIKVVSSNATKKNLDPDTPEGLKEVQSLVDALGGVFASTAARYLGINQDKLESYQGRVFVGQAALEKGFVNEIAYRDVWMSQLAEDAAPKQFPAAVAHVPETETTAETPPVVQEATAEETLSLANEETEGQKAAEESDFDTIKSESQEVHTVSANNNNTPDKGAVSAAFGTLGQFLGLSASPSAQGATEKTAREIALEGKAREGFLATAAPKVVPAATDALSDLYAAAQSAGIEDKVEALVAALPAHNLTSDRLAPAEGGYKDATQGTGDGNKSDAENADLKAAAEAVDNFYGQTKA